MIHCKELNSDFDSTKDMIKALCKHKDEIIAMKKSQIYKSSEKGLGVTTRPLDLSKIETEEKAAFNTLDFYYIAVNSINILDQHNDLHLKGLWNKTTKEQQGKNYLVADHALELDKTIVKREYVKMLIEEIPFSMLNMPYSGDTQVLIYKVRKDKVINDTAKKWLDSGDSIQASVRMQYVDLDFAVKSDEKEDKKYRDNYEKWFSQIANKEDFENEIMYFWGVKQAKNVYESSLVLFGSNYATGLINQPSVDTGKNIEPQESTLNYEYLINNLKL